MQTNAGKWYLAVFAVVDGADASARAYAHAARKQPHAVMCGQCRQCAAVETALSRWEQVT